MQSDFGLVDLSASQHFSLSPYQHLSMSAGALADTGSILAKGGNE
jgi:hypothetical protein